MVNRRQCSFVGVSMIIDFGVLGVAKITMSVSVCACCVCVCGVLVCTSTGVFV